MWVDSRAQKREDMAIGRDFGIIYIEEVIENLRINKITKRKWADNEQGQKQNLILRVNM